MDARRLRTALALASAGIGVVAVFAPRQVGRAFGLKGREARDRIFEFGLAELAAGAMVLHDPKSAGNMWMRIGEETFDLGALSLALLNSKRRGRAAWLVALVGAVMLSDFVASRRMAGQS